MTDSPWTLPIRQTGATGPRPLDGVRVVDFTRVLAGPFGTQILGDLGADVIKIENPAGGDDTRAIGQPSPGGHSPMFLSLNRSKRSVALDLKSEAGRQVALDLIAQADVLVENFSGAVMRRLRLDYPSLRELFPALIYCSVSGYGRSGSNADAAGFDSPLSAEAGVLGINAYEGTPPVIGGVPYTDVTTALNATIGVLAALRARDITGRGQHVDIAMFDAALANLSFKGCEYLATGRDPALGKVQGPMPTGIYETSDGAVVITCASDKMFRALSLDVVGRPDWLEDPRFASRAERLRNGEAFLAQLRDTFKTQPSRVWSERCKRAGIPCGPVRTPGEALTSPEAQEHGLVFGLAHPVYGVAPAIAQPVRLSETPCAYGAPPVLGEHTREVLRSVAGYDEDRIAQLVADGVIALAAPSESPSAPDQ
jgi:crotonobetainyl-CoA:carnitine CoA-transferase CaiB-like acyl-CoA transferase